MQFNFPVRALLARLAVILGGLLVIYILCVGAFSTVAKQSYRAPETAPATDQARAACMAEALVQPLEEELDSLFGWLPNDLFLVPRIIDNKTSYQRGVVYATRQASDVLAKAIARYGDRDTVPALLVSATSRDFAYAENVWGWWAIYNSEKRYRDGIDKWRQWASLVDSDNKKQAQIYNLTTNNVVEIINWANSQMEFTLGVLNDVKVGHFQSDDVIYYVKGVCRVVDNVLEGLVQCDSSLVERGGKENVEEVLRRFHMISQFNPVYVVAGSYGVGDSFWPNHIAAMARHIDIVSNRLTDIARTMEK
ncbi:MAG: DUF2333 family protein [Desulfovibrionaceae bacterium]|nr:DUF2333 family protein [Desulfovibrionaceae bacterium]